MPLNKLHFNEHGHIHILAALQESLVNIVCGRSSKHDRKANIGVSERLSNKLDSKDNRMEAEAKCWNTNSIAKLALEWVLGCLISSDVVQIFNCAKNSQTNLIFRNIIKRLGCICVMYRQGSHCWMQTLGNMWLIQRLGFRAYYKGSTCKLHN